MNETVMARTQPRLESLGTASRTARGSPPWATYQDVLDAPPDKVAEVLGGRLYLQPRPAGSHTTAGIALSVHIGGPYDVLHDGLSGWWIRQEPELHFATSEDREDIVVPDMAGWRRTRMPVYPAGPFVTLAPDWVCEVLSPSTRKLDLTDKRDTYAREGIPHLWLVDPKVQSLEAFELQDGQWQLLVKLTDTVTVSAPPFVDTSFPLSALWRRKTS